jgi:Flp pilus assembly protein TadG
MHRVTQSSIPVAWFSRQSASRDGKVLVLLAILLPTMFGVAALVIDGGLLMLKSRSIQHSTDAAATAAAYDMALGTGNPQQTAETYVHSINGFSDATVTVHSPPTSGDYSGQSGYVEVIAEKDCEGKFTRAAGIDRELSVRSRSVAGLEASTSQAAVVLLDPQPPNLTVGALPLSLPSLTPLLGGLEVLGLGCLRVNGAIHVNNTWGGRDENGDQVGDPTLLRHACSCTPLLPLTRVRATDVRVAGGVDHQLAYAALNSGDATPLRANKRPVPDPYRHLPVPTVSADPANVSSTYRGTATVISLPILLPPVRLYPGVYDWIQVVAGRVIFEPGVYIIRGVNPLTQIGLTVLAGTVQAEGVMFYFTNSSSYSAVTGLPDSGDGETSPGGASVVTLFPSALINAALLNSKFSGLNAPGSPFDGMLIYQRRRDRRPILIIQQDLLLSADIAGNVYAKWGHVILTGKGTYKSAFVCGSLRVLDVLDCRIEPTKPVAAAYDVYLVE